jgi:hypothetical protein
MPNVPVSRPRSLPNFPPDVNLGSIGFSYGAGLLYQVHDSGEDDLIKTPPPMGSGR